jgi:hypothetical protein
MLTLGMQENEARGLEDRAVATARGLQYTKVYRSQEQIDTKVYLDY